MDLLSYGARSVPKVGVIEHGRNAMQIEPVVVLDRLDMSRERRVAASALRQLREPKT